MANIILKTNIVNKNYFANSVAISQKEYDSSTNFRLEIRPKEGHIVSASDFYSGFLSNDINKIIYSDSSETIDESNYVVATVFLKEGLSFKTGNKVILVPINGITSQSVNEITLLDECDHDEYVLSFQRLTAASLNSSKVENNILKEEYSIKGEAGETVLVMEKIFTPVDGYYFTKDSISHKLFSTIKRNYTISFKEYKNEAGYCIKRVYVIKYTFPEKSFNFQNSDKITFTAKTFPIPNKIVTTTADKPEEHKIYDVTLFGSSSKHGGKRLLKVRGLPGSTFQTMIRNEALDTYDVETGSFSKTGNSMISGVIPQAKPGMTYGVFKRIISIPRSAAKDTLTTEINTASDISGIKETLDIPTLTTEITATPTITLSLKAVTNVGITNLFYDADVVTTGFSYTSSNTVFGPAEPNSTGVIDFSYKLEATADAAWLSLLRRVKFDNSKAFVNWDSAYGSESPMIKEFNNAGTAILTDFDVHGDGVEPTDALKLGHKYTITTNVETVDDGYVHTDDLVYHKTLIINGVIEVHSLGTADLTIELDPFNFLLTALS